MEMFHCEMPPVLHTVYTCKSVMTSPLATLGIDLGLHLPPVRLYCAPGHANQVEGWWFLGGCSVASFIISVWQYHQPAVAFVASYPGACLTVSVSDLSRMPSEWSIRWSYFPGVPANAL